jgi:hypothetical protein
MQFNCANVIITLLLVLKTVLVLLSRSQITKAYCYCLWGGNAQGVPYTATITDLVFLHRSRGSSVSVVSGYGLDDRAIEVRFLAEAKDFSSSICVQTGSGDHPASCPVGTGGPFPGGKTRPGRDADHSPPSSADVVNE